MLVTFLVLFIGLELKHFIADYLLQPAWILVGKGNLQHPGGYAHAGLHAALSGVVLLVAGAPPAVLAGLVAAEFVLHYVLDFSKIHYSRGVEAGSNPRGFWALHGVDQLAHQLTYGAMIYVVLISRGIA